jgi:Domain of unknown function (DUF4145)
MLRDGTTPPCPACNDGHLDLDQKSVAIRETSASRSNHDEPAWEDQYAERRFAAILVCNRRACQEPVTVAGDVEWVRSDSYDEDGGPPDFTNRFEPRYMHPAPPIFRVPKTCPVEISASLANAFGAFWSDPSACANRIRVAVELLLTGVGVRRFSSGKGKRNNLSLHARIVEFEKTEKDLARALLAVKWIGNAGSHGGEDSLGRTDLFDGFDLIKYVLDEIFERRQHHRGVKTLVGTINKRKKPRSGK